MKDGRWLIVRVNPLQLDRYHQLAHARQKSLSQLVREILDQVAEQVLDIGQAPQGAPAPVPASQAPQLPQLQAEPTTDVPARNHELVATTQPLAEPTYTYFMTSINGKDREAREDTSSGNAWLKGKDGSWELFGEQRSNIADIL